MGVDQKVSALLISWSRYGSLESCITSVTGGRQGCKLGGDIFKLVYGQAMAEVRCQLHNKGIVFSAKYINGEPFWADEYADSPGAPHEVVEASFVDDTAMALIASSPKALDDAIAALLDIDTEFFHRFALNINFAKGKTEALLRYRGKHATARLDARRTSDGLRIPLPSRCGSQALHVVERYKHLGTFVTTTRCQVYDAQHRATSALTAYCPLAQKIFGSKVVGRWLKLHFMSSLVLPRLLYNTQLWIPEPKSLRKLNAVYMRVLRRIDGCCRFDGSCDINDLQVRVKLGQSSIDCLLAKARLRYFGRVVQNRHKTIWAILGVRVQGKKLPWVNTLVNDLRELHSFVSEAGLHMPDPATEPEKLVEFVAGSPDEWNDLVNRFSYLHSQLDIVARDSADDAHGAFGHACTLCPVPQPSFPTVKALEQHARVVHGARLEARWYVDGSGRCPVCETTFNARLRVLAHLSDKRRPKCREALLGGDFPRLPQNTVNHLD